MGAVTLLDVARAAGVSRATASNVFNRPEIVREPLRERVRAAAAALGYAGPSPRGRLLRAGRANAVGIAAAEPLEYFFADPWARRLLAEVARACDARGAGLALVSTAAGGHLSWSIESALVDGFLLRCGGRDLLVEVAQRRGLPFVALSLDREEPDVPAVDIDDFGAAREAARHLAALGHRRVAILAIGLGREARLVSPEEVCATRYVNVRERARGFWAGMADVGVAEAAIPVAALRNDAANMRDALALLLDGPGDPPTALLAMSDLVAMAALEALAARGLSVPGDLSVTGFDGIPESERATPPLTTLEQPYRRIAERAVAAILDGAMPAGREVLPLTLRVRASTGPVPSDRRA
jgi:DNA-binding LacI/PurR family transcriptional regulator